MDHGDHMSMEHNEWRGMHVLDRDVLPQALSSLVHESIARRLLMKTVSMAMVTRRTGES